MRSCELNIDADKAAGDARRIIFPSLGQYWGAGMRFAGTQDVLDAGPWIRSHSARIIATATFTTETARILAAGGSMMARGRWFCAGPKLSFSVGIPQKVAGNVTLFDALVRQRNLKPA